MRYQPPQIYAFYMSSFSSCYGSVQNNSSEVEYARRIWEHDETVYDDLSHIVEWIGNGEASSHAILTYYMAYFDFKSVKLEQAFRMLCSKLHLRGETQQIDRILYAFADRYFQCNPQCIFGTIDTVYSIIYSLLLLNTDLHVVQGDHKRMSRTDFIKNTMNAIRTQSNAPTYASDRLHDDHLASGVSLYRAPSTHSSISSRSCINDSNIECTPRHESYPPPGSKAWDMEIVHLLKQMYVNIRNNQISDPSASVAASSSTSRMSIVIKRSVGTLMGKNNQCEEDPITRPASLSSTNHCPSIASTRSSISTQYQTIASHLQHTELPNAYTSNAPYYKEGIVIRKHLLEKANQKAKYRDWKECFMVIDRSEIRMYKLESSSQIQNQRRRSTNRLRNFTSRSSSVSDSASQVSDCSITDAVGGGDWLSRAQMIGSIDLKHALANVLPSGYSRQRQHAFAVQQANGAVHLFQVGSADQIHEWVSTCNYWAARESKGPLASGVSSMEYGWGHCLDRVHESVVIHEWQPPNPPMMHSLLDETSQFKALCKHVEELSTELDAHRDLKPRIEHRFSGTNSKSGARAMINWENKSHYLLHEIIKYQNYCDSIEKSLELQKKVMSS
ncbi:SEC7-like protein [Rhizopus microsporus ATCC 52813]|uniref:SEC7-like protein n=1 Tax=Rhizopus microsporus ATCC 52813 TaxID=1340429 RepID=A0A2G4T061_RHIZD|nr:SEC7-like protein [Rhizopus microsporus ATCC 52813]PHZ14412.1 SEC7-like protein [Rhizopus microsporus ATCC 52813]